MKKFIAGVITIILVAIVVIVGVFNGWFNTWFTNDVGQTIDDVINSETTQNVEDAYPTMTVSNEADNITDVPLDVATEEPNIE